MKRSIALILMSVFVLIITSSCNVKDDSMDNDNILSKNEKISETSSNDVTEPVTEKIRTEEELLISQISIGNSNFRLPCKLQDFIDAGFKFGDKTSDAEINQLLNYGEDWTTNIYKDDVEFLVKVYSGYNVINAPSQFKAKDGYVCELSISPISSAKDESISLINGLKVGDSIEKAKEIFKEDDPKYTSIVWSKQNNIENCMILTGSYELSIIGIDGKITEFMLSHFPNYDDI